MSFPPIGIQPPSWLNGVQVLSHVQGGIWEINLTGYGRTLVGPYNELRGYLRVQGLGEDAHHIVGQEHLRVIRTGYTVDNAPSVALERQLHNSQISPRITGEQRYLGGRGTPRATATRAEVRNLYRSVYTSHTRFQELARISDNVLATRAPIGNVPASPTSSPAGNTAVDNRLGARTATSSPVSSRAVDNRLGARVVEEETAVVARRAESLVARQGAEKAVRSAAIRSAARVAGRAALTFARVLLTVISRVIAILDAVGLILFAAEIVSMIWDAFRDRAMNEAIEKAMKTHLTGDISAALEKHRDEIARYYAREWLKNRGSDPTFLYLSPRLTVDGFYGEKGFDFDVKLIVKSIAEDLVSVDFVEPRRDESERGPLYYHFEIRWSAQQPIYTPFDIYLSFTDFFAEHVVDSWAAHYQSGKKLASEVVNQFHLVVRTLAHISATLKYEPWFGWDPEDQRFSPHKFAVGRMEALKELSAIIDNKLIPAVSALESQRLINTGTVRWDAFWSPMRQELDPRWGESLLPSMRRIAFDMGTFGARHLEYQRLDHSQYRTRARATPIKLQEDLDFYEYLKPVSQYLPKKLAPVDPFANQLVIEQPFTVDGVTFLAPDE